MPNLTPNLSLIKPLVTEQYDIAKVTNENADIIDDALHDLDVGKQGLPTVEKVTPVDTDMVVLLDSADSDTPKKWSWLNIKASLKTYFDTIYQAILVSGTSIKTINSTSILGSGDIAVQPTLVSGTNIKTINGNSALGSGDLVLSISNLIYETEVTGSAVTSIDVTGLDINTHKSYNIEIELLNATASNAQLSMYVNGDNVATNYYSQYQFSSGVTNVLSRQNAGQVVYLDASQRASAKLHLQKVGGQAICTSIIVDNVNLSTSVNIRLFINGWVKSSSISNITQLTFTSSVTNSIGIGSKIRIYKN